MGSTPQRALPFSRNLRDQTRKTGNDSRRSFSCVAAAFIGGAIYGLASVTLEGRVFAAASIILVVLGAFVVRLYCLSQRTDEKLRASDLSYRSFYQHALEGIFRTTADGHYLDANPALARIYGYDTPTGLILGLTDISSQLYVDPSRREEFTCLMREHDQVTGFVSQIRRRDGSTIWISENARAVRDWTGKLVCYEGTVEDVTGKIEAEQAVHEGLRRAKEANAAKNAFLAAMSHELKTPLNAIIGFSEIIKGEMLGPLGNDCYRGYMGDIHASGKKLLSIISDVLDVARLEGGAIALCQGECRPCDIAARAIARARATMEDRRDIAVGVAGDLPPVDVDCSRFEQVLGNLLANALKFTPPEGQVTIRAWLGTSGGMHFAVADTGIGMAPETISAALEPFRQLDSTLARRFEGAGLGLPIAVALMKLHGGTLHIQSAIGQGTTVTVALPATRTLQKAASSAA